MRRSFPLYILMFLPMLAQAASPTLGSINPRGFQRGTDAVIAFNGNNLADAQEIVWYTPGIAVLKLEIASNAAVKVTAKLPPDMRLGEHHARVRCATGISEMRTFWVGALPVIAEVEPNSNFLAPQKIAMNVTVHGVVDNEDVDYYAVEVKKGQRISAEIEAMRLGTTFFDPYIAILDSKRFELAANDDHPLLGQDAAVSAIAPADGVYTVMVRETSYGGNGSCAYRLHVGTFPRPSAIVPAGGKPGEELEVRFIGDPTGEFRRKIKVPADATGVWPLFAEDAGGISPSAFKFRVDGNLTNAVEVEPNDTYPTATPGVVPGAFNGVIGKVGDVDIFRFAAKKGQVFDVHCYARRIGSALDPVIYFATAAGGIIVGNDDSNGPDSYLRVTVPADGEYAIAVQDHLIKGGPNFFYRIEIAAVPVRTDLSIPQTAQYRQDRQSIAVPKGNRFATMVSTSRVNYGGDINLEIGNLPGKVTAATETVAGNMASVPVVFEAAADAPNSGTLATIGAKHIDPKQNIPSAFSMLVEHTISAPGQSLYCGSYLTKPSIVVTEAVPFRIDIVEPKVPLVHGGSMNVKIVATRAAGFKGAITILPLYNPPGVGSAGSVVIPEGQTEVMFPMNANGGAPVRKWKYAVMGSATIPGGPIAPGGLVAPAGVAWASSQLATIEIAPAMVTATIERGASEQGKDTQMFVKLAVVKPFAGDAIIRLIGLPVKVETTEMKFNKDTKEIAFALKVDKLAPVGIHRNLFAQIIVTENGEQVVHSQGTAELRIDVPIPPKVAVVAPPMPVPMPKVNTPPAAVAPPVVAPPKRLTRLEQLRLEQEEREKAEKAAPKK